MKAIFTKYLIIYGIFFLSHLLQHGLLMASSEKSNDINSSIHYFIINFFYVGFNPALMFKRYSSALMNMKTFYFAPDISFGFSKKISFDSFLDISIYDKEDFSLNLILGIGAAVFN
jgi:hypothetical protein